jgi:hypothetical protein
MPLQQITVPYRPGYEFGIGADLATGSPKGLAVLGDPTLVHAAPGNISDLVIRRIQSTEELEDSLGKSDPQV